MADEIDYELIGDDLQAVIALVKGQDYDFAVQFVNYR